MLTTLTVLGTTFCLVFVAGSAFGKGKMDGPFEYGYSLVTFKYTISDATSPAAEKLYKALKGVNKELIGEASSPGHIGATNNLTTVTRFVSEKTEFLDGTVAPSRLTCTDSTYKKDDKHFATDCTLEIGDTPTSLRPDGLTQAQTRIANVPQSEKLYENMNTLGKEEELADFTLKLKEISRKVSLDREGKVYLDCRKVIEVLKGGDEFFAQKNPYRCYALIWQYKYK